MATHTPAAVHSDILRVIACNTMETASESIFSFFPDTLSLKAIELEQTRERSRCLFLCAAVGMAAWSQTCRADAIRSVSSLDLCKFPGRRCQTSLDAAGRGASSPELWKFRGL